MNKHIHITTEWIRLDQFLKFCGLVQTGGHAKQLILDGVVSINGTVCSERGKKLFPKDIVQIFEHQIEVQ